MTSDTASIARWLADRERFGVADERDFEAAERDGDGDPWRGVTLAAEQSGVAVNIRASIDWSTVNAGTFVTATSGGGLTLGVR